ncbi:hypothetical protein QN277_006034 [Acacia crassicarpa]|uniref:Bifunctional inhibitor/plant lipid transfer protein/seed storage helical domain-containing protein n=1 Tax=Acacia crassicarpa TaxID=499986 RepID=A0AAE1MAC5_9FABA|nr:hypothetical protein QN277_006034 [Acacia crassicarpa]
MASKAHATSLLLTLNLLLLLITLGSCGRPPSCAQPPSPPPPSSSPPPPPPPSSSPPPPPPLSSPPPPPPPSSSPPPPPPSSSPPPPPPPSSPPSPPPPPSSPPSPPPPPSSPPSPPPPPSSPQGSCPIDVLKLGVCADLLNSVNVTIGSPAATPCCSLLSGLVDLDAAVCLCGAITADVLGINVDVSVALSLILNDCGKNAPGFQCKNN